MSDNVQDKVPDFEKDKYDFPVPDMPPVDNKMDPDSHKGNWLWVHYGTPNQRYLTVSENRLSELTRESRRNS
jgi:hypothetical protein